ncbi:DUF1471 domain-containing protein [Pectobacteriaceae bacterium CE70]|nr:DUF1471 domain-containing protein [Pectobacteriaceae bacterium C52]WJV66812.1 DUF1471 domain-containing protein [Pectobacteriaceae bacterium CE70]WJY10806.1 DUF1471 domain-containing protein [Pectobacteriaceae bacterium C80]
MKNLKTIAIAAVLSTVSFGSFAAEYVNAQQAQQFHKIGVVTASARDLSSLQAKLAAKADQQGAKAYYITSAVGNDTLRGTAIIYS